MRRAAAAAVVLLGALGLGSAASAQSYFRLTFNVDRSPKQIKVTGRIANDATLDASDVRLRVIALDTAGNAVAEKLASVDRVVPARGEAAWEAKFPPNSAIAGFRLVILGYDFRRDAAP